MKKILKFYPPGYNPRTYWEAKYAAEHFHKPAAEFERQHFWKLLKNYLVPNRRYLDAGCGIAGWIIFLREQGYHVEGIDTAENTVMVLKQHFPDLPVTIGSITDIPHPDQSFDGVLAIGTLEYVENHFSQALREVSRVLKPDGIFFIEVPAFNILRRWLYVPLKTFHIALMNSRGQKPTFSHYLFTRRTIRKQLHRAGFDVLEMQPHELPGKTEHYGLYVDWFLLRGPHPYQLNRLGLLIKRATNAISPWVSSTGIVVVARKRA